MSDKNTFSTGNAISETNFNFPGQTGFARGKVRDIYFFGEEKLVMIATDRISAFDVILPQPIPYKGEILNLIAAYNLRQTVDIVPNWLLSVPDPACSYGLQCSPFKIEMVIRGFMCGHAWRVYKEGGREICGNVLPRGLKQNDKFPEPIITPTIKAEEGHDEDISGEDIVARGLVSEEDYRILKNYTNLLYRRGTELAQKRGLILADTKYEFGKRNGKIYLIDEVHTPDSSRYFNLDGYYQRQQNGVPQKQLSKEFVREWLMSENFMGQPGRQVPEMTDSVIQMIQSRYIELFETFTGEKFNFSDRTNVEQRIMENVRQIL